jgi:hypothetical protein
VADFGRGPSFLVAARKSPADWPTILAMSGNTPIPVTFPKKPILQEELILYPSLIDLDFEVNPLSYAAAVPLQPEAAGPPEPPHSSASPPAPPALVSGPVRGLRPRRQQEETQRRSPPPLPPGPPSSWCRPWVVLVPMGDVPISIGLFQVVTCTTGKPRILLFLRTLEA